MLQVIHDYDKLGIQVLLAAPARKYLIIISTFVAYSLVVAIATIQLVCSCYSNYTFCCLAPICHKLSVIGFFKKFGPQWVFPSIQGAVEFAKSGEKVVSDSSVCMYK